MVERRLLPGDQLGWEISWDEALEVGQVRLLGWAKGLKWGLSQGL